MLIHPTAIIHPEAKVDPATAVGPYAVVEQGVEIGPNCVLGPQVYILGDTVIGSNNLFHAGCVVGDAPQDLKYGGEPTRLVIGDANVFREHVTVHRSNDSEEATVVGSRNFLMANSHVGHNCRIGNEVILANGALLGGHVAVGDRAFISGNCLVHQFVRIGTLSLMQGGASVSKDVPPFVIATGVNSICGLNSVGLKRAGFSILQRTDLKRLYKYLLLAGSNFREAIRLARSEFQSEEAKTMIDFLEGATRGVCLHSINRSER